jgi:hypothetical protein
LNSVIAGTFHHGRRDISDIVGLYEQEIVSGIPSGCHIAGFIEHSAATREAYGNVIVAIPVHLEQLFNRFIRL